MADPISEPRSGGLGLLDLEGRVAVVTGGSSGIGAATARLLAGHGASVVVGYHGGRQRAVDLVGELPGDHHRTLHLPIQDSAALESARDAVVEYYGRCDVLVNSAGSTRHVPHADLDSMTDELFDEMMRINVRGPFAAMRSFAPLLTASGDGVIVNISSLSASTAVGSNVGYCAAKAALDNLTMSMARVLGPQVRVIGVAPCAVETGFVTGRGHDALVDLATATPLKVVLHPADVAAAVLAAITHLRTATGTTLVVDGGTHL